MEENDETTLADFVGGKVTTLQNSYVYGERRGSAADLARLRRAVGKTPGADPDIWSSTVERLPQAYVGRTDAASAGEQAAYAALTLYAVHQQSKTTAMHREGPSLGRAVAKLAKSRGSGGSDESSPAVKRRFDALVTASTFAELLFHSRGIIQQLRAADISLDYGRFAEDLRRLQLPSQADVVRRQWGRDYSYELYASRNSNPSADAAATDNQ